jgi:hypothetical protein
MKDKKNKNLKNKREERGFVLVVGVIITSFLLLLAIPFMFKINTERRLSDKSLKTLSALSLAEAGIERAIWEMNEGDLLAWSGDSDLRTIAINGFQSSAGSAIGDIQISVIDPEGDTPVIEATGSVPFGSNTITRTIRVGLQYNYPIPAPENAINFYGSPTKHAKIKIFDHETTPNGRILISGVDNAGGPDRLAFAIEDPDQLAAMVESLGKELGKGGSLKGTMVGDPMETWEYGTEGFTFDASIGLADPDVTFDCEMMETYIQQLAADAQALALTPTQTIFIEGKEAGDAFIDPDGDGYVNLGGSEDDVVLLTGGKLKLEGDLTIEGTGTLIFDGGKMEMKSVASFDWDGDIYILGSDKKGDAEFKIKKGTYDITGDIYVIGEGNGKAKIEFNNDDTEENNSYTHLLGSILAAGGTGDKSKAEFKVKNGDVDIEGMITLYGNKTKLDLHQKHKSGGANGEWLANDDSDIRIVGGISLMVPDASKPGTKQKAEISIHDHKVKGDEVFNWEGMIEILYDSSVVRAAVKRFAAKLDLTERYSILSWQERRR